MDEVERAEARAAAALRHAENLRTRRFRDEQIVRLVESGWSYADAGAPFGVTRQWVQKILERERAKGSPKGEVGGDSMKKL